MSCGLDAPSQKWGYPPALQYSVGSPGGAGRLSSAVVLGHIIFCLLGDLCSIDDPWLAAHTLLLCSPETPGMAVSCFKFFVL